MYKCEKQRNGKERKGKERKGKKRAELSKTIVEMILK